MHNPLQLFGRAVAVFVTTVDQVSIVWVLPLAVVLVASFLFLRQYYLRTSRDVKRLEAIGAFSKHQEIVGLFISSLYSARSPVYSHISMTLQGLSTIRAFEKRGTALDFFHKYQNEHTQVHTTELRACAQCILILSLSHFQLINFTECIFPFSGLSMGSYNT